MAKSRTSGAVVKNGVDVSGLTLKRIPSSTKAKTGKMKSYKETKAAVKEMVLNTGIDNIKNIHLVFLHRGGHDSINVRNALDFFKYSPKAAKYR